MRFIHLYLIAYFVLLLGATFAMWQAGVLQQISGTWLFLTALIVVGLGVLLAVTSTTPTVTRE
jgi:hypothetical protein